MPRNYHTFDVLILGAGSAGITALKTALKYTKNVALIHDGPIGTTCARVGCMPSKALIYAAKLYDSRRKMPQEGIQGVEWLTVNTGELMQKVQQKRDHFVNFMVKETEDLSDYIICGKAEYEDANTLRVEDKLLHTKASIIATGSTPHIPEAYRHLQDKIITTDSLFQCDDLPKRLGVIGLGAVGLEMAQAFAMLGVEVTACESATQLSLIADEQIQHTVLERLRQQFSVYLGCDPKVAKQGNALKFQAGDEVKQLDALFIAAGRQSNIKDLGLKKIGARFTSSGIPFYNRFSMKLPDLPIYLAGDSADEREVLHEAIDEGQRAAYHACHDKIHYRPRYPNMQIIFTDPVIAIVGETGKHIPQNDTIIGEASFECQGRAYMEQQNYGKIRLYATRSDGLFRGAEIMAPAAEHQAHFLSLALSQHLSINDMLEAPFYHPTLEEGLKTALKDAQSRIR